MILKDYMKSENINTKQLASQLGTSAAVVCHILQGIRGVSKKRAKKIEKVTEGKVSLLEALYPEDFEEETSIGKQLRFPKCPKKGNNI